MKWTVAVHWSPRLKFCGRLQLNLLYRSHRHGGHTADPFNWTGIGIGIDGPARHVAIVGNKPIRSAHLIIGINIRGPEVDDDVNEEHDVHYKIHHVEGGTGVTTGLYRCLLLVTKEKCNNKQMNGFYYKRE